MANVNKTRSRSSFNIDTKIKAIEDIIKGVPTAKIAANLQCNPATVRSWKKRQQSFKDSIQNDTDLSKKRICKVKNSRVDEALWIWYQQHQTEGIPLSGPLLRTQALKFHEQLEKSKHFQASEGWFSKWKERHNIRNISFQRLSYTYRGLIVPVLTPFNSNGSLNLDIIPQYATHLAKKGIKGILVNGTSGEGMSMSIDERKLITEAWVKAVRETKQHLMIQVGGAPLPDVIELAKHANSLRVDSILCLPELYFKPTTPEQLIEYLEIVGKAAPETPLLYYHIPMLTNVNIHMGQFLESIGDKIPSFVGIKFTSSNLEEGAQALRANSRKYVIFLGNDQLINAACALGMDSFIVTSGNMFPELILDLLAACKNGDTLRAKDMQEKLSSAVIVIIKHGNWVETMKMAMTLLTDIDTGLPRAPLKSISSEAVVIMTKDLTNLGYKLN
ncbi:N-acetylneuraminate lyase isoform X2 [Monomorium pharaonis]|uniref:N-acetylneuraminate lyase isoform X2 n=1 Tax=Monomorium pharaonis TaxID=307658 RepID=UPI00063FB2EC|nr:N-acetylneuraminate lyase isoform X2 [Monomorium pharaonis]